MDPRKHVLDEGALWRNLGNTNLIEPSVCGDDAGGDEAFMSNYFDHLFDNVSREASWST